MNTKKRIKLTIHGFDADRFVIARKSEREWAKCEALLGKSAKGYRRLVLHDRLGKLPDQVRYEIAGSVPDFALAFGAMCDERNYLEDAVVGYPPGKTSIVAYKFRFESWAGSVVRYQPLNEADRAVRSETRKARAAEREDKKWNEAHPLFAEV